jgi:NADPH:quinone reductase-like Zn-dependent oxidoreductase
MLSKIQGGRTDMSTVGKVAVITGAAGGIGLAISQRYARDGMVVVLTDLPGVRGEREAAALRESGHDARFEPLDTTDEAAVEALFDKIVADLGGIDVVRLENPFKKPRSRTSTMSWRSTWLAPSSLGRPPPTG